jgi:hypothetical protein
VITADQLASRSPRYEGLRIGANCRTARATRGLLGLDWLNFLVANFLTGFGPFILVYLTGAG